MISATKVVFNIIYLKLHLYISVPNQLQHKKEGPLAMNIDVQWYFQAPSPAVALRCEVVRQIILRNNG